MLPPPEDHRAQVPLPSLPVCCHGNVVLLHRFVSQEASLPDAEQSYESRDDSCKALTREFCKKKPRNQEFMSVDPSVNLSCVCVCVCGGPTTMTHITPLWRFHNSDMTKSPWFSWTIKFRSPRVWPEPAVIQLQDLLIGSAHGGSPWFVSDKFRRVWRVLQHLNASG